MKPKQQLIIFTRNPVYGKVKTRLAATIGHQRALEVHKLLVEHTRAVTSELQCEKKVYYADDINNDDNWNGYLKAKQQGQDLGERMFNAVTNAFNEGHNEVLIIGTDCFEITADLISKAFNLLKGSDLVMGPAVDGGYYLVGMKTPQPAIFQNIPWSTDQVLQLTINQCKLHQLSFDLLPVLNDVDEEKDLNLYPALLKQLAGTTSTKLSTL